MYREHAYGTSPILLPVLGVPLAFISDVSWIRQMVASRFGQWSGIPEELVSENPPMPITFCQCKRNPAGQDNGRMAYKVSEQEVRGTGCGVSFKACRRTGQAEARIGPDVGPSEFFLYKVLECMALFLATSRNRVPVHAAALVRDQAAYLLFGPSSAGKSTLSYLLHRRGADLLAESAMYLSYDKSLRLWGDPQAFSFRPDAVDLFPELKAILADLHPDDSRKFRCRLPFAGQADRRRLHFSGPIHAIAVERSTIPGSRLRPVSRMELLDRLKNNREPGFDLSSEYDQAISRLPLASSSLLENGKDFEQAACLLESLGSRS